METRTVRTMDLQKKIPAPRHQGNPNHRTTTQSPSLCPHMPSCQLQASKENRPRLGAWARSNASEGWIGKCRYRLVVFHVPWRLQAGLRPLGRSSKHLMHPLQVYVTVVYTVHTPARLQTAHGFWPATTSAHAGWWASRGS